MNQQTLGSKLKPTATAKTARSTSADSGRLNAVQRNAVRMMLATGATIATLISAQAMATLDRTANTASPAITTVNNAVSSLPTPVASPTVTAPATATTSPQAAQPTVQPAVSQPKPVSKSSR